MLGATSYVGDHTSTSRIQMVNPRPPAAAWAVSTCLSLATIYGHPWQSYPRPITRVKSRRYTAWPPLSGRRRSCMVFAEPTHCVTSYYSLLDCQLFVGYGRFLGQPLAPAGYDLWVDAEYLGGGIVYDGARRILDGIL